MLLSIKIYDSTDEDASKIIAAVTKTLADIRKTRNEASTSASPYMNYSFDYEKATSQPVYQTGSCVNTTFANYMNSTKRE